MPILTKIKIKNFMCFRELELDLESRGLVAIEGKNFSGSSVSSNGSGKSAIYDAIFWILFGKSLRGLKVDDLMHEHYQDDGIEGFAWLRDEYNKIYQIRRYRNHKKHKNNLFLYKIEQEQEIDLRGSDNRDTQTKINNLLRMSANLFCQIVLFGEYGSHFGDLSDSAKKALLEEAMQIHIYMNAAQKVRALRNAVSKLLSEQEIRLEEIKKRLQLADQWIQKIQEQYKFNNNDKIVELQQQIKELELKIQQENNSELERQYQELIQTKERMAAVYHQKRSELQQQIAVLEAEYKKQQEWAEQVDGLYLDNICPTCLQPINLSKLPDPRELYHKAFKIKTKAANLRDQIQSLEIAYKKLQQKNIDEQGRLRQQNEKVREWIQNLQRLKNELKQMEQNNQAYQRMMEDAQQNKKNIQIELSTVGIRIDKYSKEESKYKILEYVFGPKGIRAFLFENSIEFFNQRLKYYSELISNGQIQAYLEATTQSCDGSLKEEINIIVVTPSRKTTYNKCSSGERRRLDLPIAFALQDLAYNHGVYLGLTLLDEVFEHVDRNGVFGVMSLLQEIKKRPYTSTVLAITHDEELLSMFSNRITVLKENDISRLEC